MTIGEINAWAGSMLRKLGRRWLIRIEQPLVRKKGRQLLTRTDGWCGWLGPRCLLAQIRCCRCSKNSTVAVTRSVRGRSSPERLLYLAADNQAIPAVP